MKIREMEAVAVHKIVSGIIKGVNLASLATVKEGKPWVRYMMVYNYGENLHLYSSTSINSRKVAQIRKDPNVHIALGWTDMNKPGSYIQFSGKAIVRTDQELREKHWHKELESYFQSPDNPAYCVLEFIPDYIEVFGYEGDMESYLVLEVKE